MQGGLGVSNIVNLHLQIINVDVCSRELHWMASSIFEGFIDQPMRSKKMNEYQICFFTFNK